MSGEAIQYPGTINCNALRVGGLHIISGGIPDPPPGDRYQSFVHHDPAALTYKKIVTKDDRIVEMIFVNDIASAGVVLRLIKQMWLRSCLQVSSQPTASPADFVASF